MSRNRARKKRERQQRNAKEQDTFMSTRRPTSGFVRALMRRYHETIVAPLAARVVLLEQILAENSIVVDDRISFYCSGQTKPEAGSDARDVQDCQPEQAGDAAPAESTASPARGVTGEERDD